MSKNNYPVVLSMVWGLVNVQVPPGSVHPTSSVYIVPISQDQVHFHPLPLSYPSGFPFAPHPNLISEPAFTVSEVTVSAMLLTFMKVISTFVGEFKAMAMSIGFTTIGAINERNNFERK